MFLQAVSSVQVFQPKFCFPIFIPTCVLHALPTSLILVNRYCYFLRVVSSDASFRLRVEWGGGAQQCN
jgi:hypothetical protein